jgi:hypothetical protein
MDRVAALLFICSLGAWLSCSRTKFSDASGTLDGLPREIPELHGRGIWIRHDGLTVGRDKLVPMRAPFAYRGEIGDLQVGDRITFKYRPLEGRGFPFEAKELRRLPASP